MPSDFIRKEALNGLVFYKNAIKESRKIKPQIPEFGYDKIPIKHESEFEYILD